jgi:uncharacterized protein YqeY
MSQGRPTEMEARLRDALTAARKARDATAVSALRSAIAAIDNAGAVDIQAPGPVVEGGSRIVGTVGALGTGEAARRELGPDDVRALLESEVEARHAAARTYEEHGRDDRAATLREEASVIASLLSSAPE